MTSPLPVDSFDRLGDAFLCSAWGETECKVVRICHSEDEVREFFIEEWHGGEGEELDEAMTLFQNHNFAESPKLRWDFEIGGVEVEDVLESVEE
jgi:hypothetical protein